MKRKIALALATVMTFAASVSPVSLTAASNAWVDVFMQGGARPGGVIYQRYGNIPATANDNTTVPPISSTSANERQVVWRDMAGASYSINGFGASSRPAASLIIELQQPERVIGTADTGVRTFTIELTNMRWAFISMQSLAAAGPNANPVQINANYDNTGKYFMNANSYFGGGPSIAPSAQAATTPPGLYNDNTYRGSIVLYNKLFFPGAFNTATSMFDLSIAQPTYNPTVSASQTQSLAYELEIDYRTPNRATVTYYIGAGTMAGAYLEIPIVGVSTGTGNPTARIVTNGTSNVISTQTIDLVRASNNTGTNAYVQGGVVNAVGMVGNLNPIVIEENAIGAITASQFFIRLQAPAGFEWGRRGTGAAMPNLDFGLTTGTTATTTDAAGASGGAELARVSLSNLGDPSTLRVTHVTFGQRGSGGSTAPAAATVNPNPSLGPTVPANANYVRPEQEYIIDRTVLIIRVNNVSSDRSIGGTIVISELALVPTAETLRDPSGIPSNTDLSVVISGNNGISTPADKTLPVLRFASAGINVTGGQTGNVRESGRLGQRHDNSRVTLTETATGAWNLMAGTTFTLTDINGAPLTKDVRIQEVQINEIRNVVGFSGTLLTGQNSASPTTRQYQNTAANSIRSSANQYFSEDGRSFTLSRLAYSVQPVANDGSDTASMRFDFRLSAEPSFTGQVYLTISGTGVDGRLSQRIVPLMNFRNYITVSSSLGVTYIGYQTFNVADITIRENRVAALSFNDTISFEVTEFGQPMANANDFWFNPITIENNVTVTGNMRLSIANDRGQRPTLRVVVPSSGAASNAATITIRNLAVRIDRTVPQGIYGLAVRSGNPNGAPLQENWASSNADVTNQFERGFFYMGYMPAYGYAVEEFIRVATVGDQNLQSPGLTTPISFNFANGTTTMLVNGVSHTLVSPIINENGRTLIPIRSITEAMGGTIELLGGMGLVPGTNQETRVIRVIIDNVTVLFYENTDVYTTTLGGIVASYTMPVDSAGRPVITQIRPEYDRTYVPFRGFGEAFGIHVDSYGSSAYFNPPAR